MSLKELRVAAGFTQQQISELSGIPQSNYSVYERSDHLGEKPARKLAPVFGMPWYELIERIGGSNDKAAAEK